MTSWIRILNDLHGRYVEWQQERLFHFWRNEWRERRGY